MKLHQCKYCKIDLELGQSIDVIDENIKFEYTPYSKGNLIRCWKCPKCGYSEE